MRKIGRLDRLLDDRTDAAVELSRAAHRAQHENAIVEVTLLVDGRPLRAVARAATHRAATDQVVDRLERQVVDHKERRSRPAERRSAADVGGGGDMPTTLSDADPPSIVKVKRFAIEPMFEEDAVTRMEELGHDFFVFVNAESERTAVLYRRRDGDYGLIEPTVGGRYSSGLAGDESVDGRLSASASGGRSASGRSR
jgi:putative sigma-54 modulation protein